MKKIIKRISDSKSDKYYVNHLGQKYGIDIRYYPWYDGSVWCKTNYINDKHYGLETWYHERKIGNHIYHL